MVTLRRFSSTLALLTLLLGFSVPIQPAQAQQPFVKNDAISNTLTRVPSIL